MISGWRKVAAGAILVVVALSVGCATVGLVETIESLLKQIKELLTAQKWDAALTKVAEVIRREPTEGRAYLYGAQAYIGKADWSDAGRMLVDGLTRASDPAARAQLVQGLLDGGRQALSRGEYQGAAGLLREYVRQQPSDVSALLDLGKAYWNSDERTEARGAFRRVLELAPQNEEARRFLFGR